MKDYNVRTTVGVDFGFTAVNDEDAKKELRRIVVEMCSVNGVDDTSLEPVEIESLIDRESKRHSLERYLEMNKEK